MVLEGNTEPSWPGGDSDPEGSGKVESFESFVLVLTIAIIIATIIDFGMGLGVRMGGGGGFSFRGGGATISTQSKATGSGKQQTSKGVLSGSVLRSYEGDLAAVDTWVELSALAGSSQTMQIPLGVNAIVGLHPSLAVDYGTSALGVRSAVQFKIEGEGVPGGPHTFGGPSGSATIVTSGGGLCQFGARSLPDVNIPVNPGGTYTISASLIGEDPGDATAELTIEFGAR